MDERTRRLANRFVAAAEHLFFALPPVAGCVSRMQGWHIVFHRKVLAG
jgi:hypothetical protein